MPPVICDAEEGGDGSDYRGDEEVLRLTDLALVAGTDIPLDVFLKVGPPETNEEVLRGRKVPFVT